MKKSSIYELRDPRDTKNEPRYIGCTVNNINLRLAQHIRGAKHGNISRKDEWIRSLLNEGIKPTTHTIEEVDNMQYGYKVEKYYIKEFKDQGHDLLNENEGYFLLDENILEKLSQAHLGLKHTEETKLKMSLIKKGILFSDEHKLKLKENHKGTLGKKYSEESKLKMSIAQKNKQNKSKKYEGIL